MPVVPDEYRVFSRQGDGSINGLPAATYKDLRKAIDHSWPGLFNPAGYFFALIFDPILP